MTTGRTVKTRQNPHQAPVDWPLPAATGLPAAADAPFDRFAQLVRSVLGVPVALVALVDIQRQVFPGASGLPEPWATTRATPLSHSFCQQVVRRAEPLIVCDAEMDVRVAGNPAVRELGVVAYAGMPLVDEEGRVTGSLCAIDHQPRVWTKQELGLLSDLAAACSAELQLRGTLRRVAQREAALQASEEQFRVAFDGAPIGMALMGVTAENAFEFMRVNAALGELTGYTDWDLLGSKLSDYNHPGDDIESDAAWQRLIDGEITRRDTEQRLRHANGRYLWVHLSISVVRDESGQPLHAIAQFVDISASRARSAELEERFRELATTVDVGFTLRQLEPPAYLYVNPAFNELFGFDPDGPLPSVDAVAGRMHPDEANRAQELARLFDAGTGFDYEFRTLVPSGASRTIKVRYTPITSEQGRVVRMAAVYADITERVAVDAVLRESQSRFEQLARSTEVGFFLREGPEMLFVNGAFLRIFGNNPDRTDATVPELLSKFHPDDKARAEQIAAAADLGESNDIEARLVDAAGAVRWVHITNDSVLDDDGRMIRVAGTVEDITARKAAEAATLAARDEAERANAAKDEFLSRMSHELRTPLNAVLGFAQLLQLDDLNPAHEHAVGHILQGGNHLLAMIDDILDITGGDTGQLALTLEPVAVSTLVTEAVGLMQTLADENGIVLYVGAQGAAATRPVWADARRLNQVLLNLLANAIKYNRPGGRVDITLRLAADDQLAIAVNDNGIGIPAVDLPRLFNPFDRLGRQSLNIEGTGIGLALTQSLVRAMNGRIEVTSAEGLGSTFTVLLPQHHDAPLTATATTRDVPGQGLAETTGAGGGGGTGPTSTMLYIEDNPSNADLLTGILQRRPEWRIEHAADGGQGLEAARRQVPTAILLDLHLPDMSGLEVLLALRDDPVLNQVPVAILTADANPSQVAELLGAGATAYFTKPLKIREVLGFLDEQPSSRRPTG